MKTATLLLFVLPGLCLAQTDNLPAPRSVLPTILRAETLKPIEFREIPYQYTTHSSSTYRGHTTTSSSTNTGIHRIYTYDGIDVDDPETTLWPTLLAINDPNVERLRLEFNEIKTSQETATTMGTVLMVPGLIAACIGAAQAKEYQNQVAKQNSSYYTVMQPTTTYTTRTCGTWTGSGSGGTTNWTCASDPTWKYTGDYPPLSQQVPTTVSTPVTTRAPASPVTVSDGKGLMIGGLASMLVGTIVFCSGRRGQSSTFLRAVQYYNRALKQNVSWELRPYSSVGTAGPSVVVRF